MYLCFVGDSFVNGVGDPECLGWTGRLCADANRNGHEITYYNLGIRRETSADIRRRWPEEVARRMPDGCDGRVIFSFGINDTTLENGRLRVALSQSIKETRQILHIAREKYPVLMIGPPPMADPDQHARIARLSEAFSLLCRERKIPYIDTFTALLQSDCWMKEVAAQDGAHPGPPAMRKWRRSSGSGLPGKPGSCNWPILLYAIHAR